MQPAIDSMDLHALLAEHSWLQRLARRLVRDASEADDVAQETIARALRSPSLSSVTRGGSLRGWLAVTARNVVSETGRRASRRRGREVEAALPEADTRNADALERAELRETLARLVMELPEIDRMAVILRYFEDLDSKAIAERLGLPSSGAARQRVSRGVARLRERLDAKDGRGGAGWLAVAAGMLHDAPVATKVEATAAATGVGGSLWLLGASAVGVLALGVAAFFALGNGNEPESVELALVERAAEAPAESRVVISRPESGGARSAPADAAREDVEPDALAAAPSIPGDIRLFEPRVDRLGHPVPAAGVPFRLIETGTLDDGGVIHVMDGTMTPAISLFEGVTDASGEVRIPESVLGEVYPAVEFGGTPLLNLMTERTERFARGSWPIRLFPTSDASEANTHFTLSEGARISGRLVDDAGRPHVGASVSIDRLDESFVEVARTAADGSFVIERIADLPRAFVFDAEGKVVASRVVHTAFRFVLGEDDWRIPSDYDILGDESVRVKDDDELDLGAVVVGRPVTLRGRVVDPSDHGIAGTLVSVRFGARPSRGDEPRPGETLTARDGAFELRVPWRQVQRGGLRLFVGHSGALQAEATVDGLTAGEEREDVTVRIDPTETVRFRLVDAASGEPIEAPRADFGDGARAKSGRTPAGFDPRLESPIGDDGLVAFSRAKWAMLGKTPRLDVPGYEPETVIPADDGSVVEVRLRESAVVVATIRSNVLVGRGADECIVRVRGVGVAGAAGPDPRAAARYDPNNDLLLQRVASGTTLRVPCFDPEGVFVIVEPVPHQGRNLAAPSVFGPLRPGDGPVELEATVEGWPLPPLSEGSGPWADQRPATLRLRIVDAAGRPVVGATAHFDRFRRADQRDTGDPVTFEVPPGSGRLRVSADGFAERSIELVELKRGEERDLGDVRLER